MESITVHCTISFTSKPRLHIGSPCGNARFRTAVGAGNTTAETADNILCVILESITVNTTVAVLRKPVFQIVCPRGHAGLTGFRTAGKLGFESLYQIRCGIFEITGLGLNTLHETGDKALSDLLHVDKHTCRQFHITVTQIFNLREKVFVFL